MSRVILFSRAYPKYHVRSGESTFFVEKIIKSFHHIGHPIEDIDELAIDGVNGLDIEMYHIIDPKYHTIRSGKRWKAGMKFSPRVWSGKPYASKQIILAPDIEIKKVYDFEIKDEQILIDGRKLGSLETVDLALNDGLHMRDFFDWFKWPQPFSGQIICWNENIEYHEETYL